MRELTLSEFEMAAGGHGFTESDITSAILTGASVGAFWGAKGALIGGALAGFAYIYMTSAGGGGDAGGRYRRRNR